MHDYNVNHRAEPVGGGGGVGQGEGVTLLYKLGSCSAKRYGFYFNPLCLKLSGDFRVLVGEQASGIMYVFIILSFENGMSVPDLA